jgi:hypothetical protein
MGERYRLRFGSEDLGEVIQENADFPSLFGRWSQPANPIGKHLMEYIVYSREQDRIGMSSGFGSDWERFVEEHEKPFFDLIESDAWSLEDESGSRERICVPIFTDDGGVVWRWNFSRDD